MDCEEFVRRFIDDPDRKQKAADRINAAIFSFLHSDGCPCEDCVTPLSKVKS